MKKNCAILLQLLILAVAQDTLAQHADYSFAVAIRGSYTTTSKLFFSPHSETPEFRALHDEYEDVLGSGFEIRWKPKGENFFFAFTVDVLKKTQENPQFVALTSPPSNLPLTDGFSLFPLEISANIYIPTGSETIRFFMGGGLSTYYSERILKVLGVNADPVGWAIGYGIHIRTSVEYRIFSKLFFLAEMKFRDPDIELKNRFSDEPVLYQGRRLFFPKNDIPAKLNVDGMNLSVGFMYEF